MIKTILTLLIRSRWKDAILDALYDHGEMYSLTILNAACARLGIHSRLSGGIVLATLIALEEDGLVVSRYERPDEYATSPWIRGGRRRKLFAITEKGVDEMTISL